MIKYLCFRGRWGIYDLDDCCHGAQYLADVGKADHGKLCIDGRSAGGYSTLACLTFKNVFGAGKIYMNSIGRWHCELKKKDLPWQADSVSSKEQKVL